MPRCPQSERGNIPAVQAMTAAAGRTAAAIERPKPARTAVATSATNGAAYRTCVTKPIPRTDVGFSPTANT